MKTDKQIFLIFETEPEWFFDLIGKPSPGECRMKSVTVKALQRTTDGLIEPLDPSHDLTLTEFQFQPDTEVYLRLVESMTGAQRSNGMRRVHGVIIFIDSKLDPKTEPWCQIIETYDLRVCLENLERREPAHPLVSVFKPLLEKQEDVLERHAAEYYQAITSSSLKSTQINVLADVFIDWLSQRLSKKTKKEIEMLLFGDLPGLEKTRCGQDLIEIGEQRGEKRGEERGEKRGAVAVVTALLESRFGRVPQTIQARIGELGLDAIKSLTANVLSFECIDDVKKWLDTNCE